MATFKADDVPWKADVDYPLELGKSFEATSGTCFHSFRCQSFFTCPHVRFLPRFFGTDATFFNPFCGLHYACTLQVGHGADAIPCLPAFCVSLIR